MVTGKPGCAWHQCMGGAWGGDGVHGFLGFAYLAGGVVGLVGLDLSFGVWFWMSYGDIITPNLTPPNI